MNLHRGPRSEGDVPHPELVRPLLELPCLYAAHHHQILASYAVIGLLKFAVTPQGIADPRIRVLMKTAAADPRVLVRKHAAYGLARIEAHAPASPIKDLATELGGRLDAEPYLTISNSRRLGLAEPAYFPPLLSRLADAPLGTEEPTPSPSGGSAEG